MKENKILISILIPTYNRKKYLEECLNSVVEQEGFKKDEIEILIGDNSEGDETEKFMDRFLKRNHKYKLRYIKNGKNMGSNRNINNLLDESFGEYYIILSDDDKFYSENSLKLLYDNLNKYKLDVCYGKIKFIDGKGNVTGDLESNAKIGNNNVYYDCFDEQILWHTMTFGGILYRQFGYRYDKGSKWFGDWNMNLQYLHNEKKVGMINEYTFLYRQHSSNDSFNVPRSFYLEFALHSYKFFNISFLKRIYYFVGMNLKIIFNAVIGRIKNF